MSSMVIDSLAIMSATIGVSMAPGHTALMRIPLEAYSSAALLVSPITPCLDAWYIARPGRPIRPPMEEQLTMAPLPCSRIWRSSYFMQFQTPRRLIAFTRSISAAGISGFNGRRLHASVIVRRIQATEGGYRLLDHCCHFGLVSDIAADGNRFIAGGDQFFCCRANRILVDVC